MVQLPGKGKLKGVLFDIDGTLVDSDPLHFLAWRELLLEKGYNGGVPIEKAWFTDKLSGGHNPEAVAFLFPGISDADNAAVADDKEARFRALAASEGLQPNEGLMEFIEWINAQGIMKAAVTNAPRPNMEAMLKAIGLYDKFDAIIVGEECARAKPFPDPYLDAAKLLGLGIDEVFAVEDSPSGIQAAVAGDIPVIALTVGHPRAKLEAARATHVLDNFGELADLVKKTQL
jgi:HAD superfamily hydrolase (TIGR01509 family)